MSIVIITGSAGLIGSEAARFFHNKGFEVIGIDNNMRSYFFGQEASTAPVKESLEKELKHYTHYDFDIRNTEEIKNLFSKYSHNIELIIHAAAQPSHDWASREPYTDFTINANGTLNLLEATRNFCGDAIFIFTSTNKVYGDLPNKLPLVELPERWEVDASHPFAQFGIDETMSIDQSKHSLFGASKVAADVLAQEYGRYFHLKTGIFRGGCLTGPVHRGAELHGFLAYLVLCNIQHKPYTIFGYKGKQVRDNIHSKDLINAFWQYFKKPRVGEVYNMGGSRFSNISILEAIRIVEGISQQEMNYTLSEKSRIGDHIWYISDVRKFQSHYPGWNYLYNIEKILSEMVEIAQRNYAQGNTE